MKFHYLAIAAMASMNLQAFAQEAAPAKTLNIKFDVMNGGELVASPRLLVIAGEAFSVEMGKRYSTAAGVTGDPAISIKCATAPQPENTLALDCKFRTTDADGENTRTKSWQAKVLVTMGKQMSMYFDAKAPNGEANLQQGLGINVLADWVKAS
jgi:hypothetical protein